MVDLAYPIPYDGPWLSSEPAGSVPCREQRNGLVKPEQLDQRATLSVLVDRAGAQFSEGNSSWCDVREQDLPPFRNQVSGFVGVALANNQRRSIEDGAVHDYLSGESTQTVAIGLDLIAVQRTVHQRHVNEDLATAQAHLLEQRDICIANVCFAKQSHQRLTDLGVAWQDAVVGNRAAVVVCAPGAHARRSCGGHEDEGARAASKRSWHPSIAEREKQDKRLAPTYESTCISIARA